MNVTSILGSTGNTDVNLKMDVWDVTNGLQGAILFIGDSITNNTLQHSNPAGNFGDLTLADGGYYSTNVPLSINAGIAGSGATTAGGSYLNLLQSTNSSISLANLIPNFPGQFVTINLGVNDEAGGTGNVSAYTTDMETIIGIIQAAGKIPIIPTITFNTVYSGSTTTAFNTAITGTLQALPGVLAGPDLYRYTNGYNSTLVGGTQSTTQAQDTGQNWAPNSYTGCTYTNTTTTGTATVTSNTQTVLTFSGGMSLGTNLATNGYNLNCQILITSNDGLHPNAQGVKNYMLVWAWWASQNLSNAATATVSNATGTFGIAGYQQLINVIRATGATNTILVGMNDYSDRVQDWLPNLITDPKPAGYSGTWVSHIAAARHPYQYSEQTSSASVVSGGSGYKGMTGTVTAGTTGSTCTLQDTSQSWTTNQWTGSFAYSANSPYKVVSNNSNTLTMTDPIGNSCWGAPSGAYDLGDRLVMSATNQAANTIYFPAWWIVTGVSGGVITTVYTQMPGEDPNGLGGTVGRGGLYNAFNSAGSTLPSNPMSVGSTSGSGTGATFTTSYAFKVGAPDSNPTSRTYEAAILAAGIPIIDTEFGGWSQPGATTEAWIGGSTGLLAYNDTAGISSVVWTWDLFGYQYMFNGLITNSGGTASPGFGTVFQTYVSTHP
jgi:lysophospholipase L1-like esterase